MEKGKFVSNPALYPLLVLFCVLFSQIWVGLLILGFVIVMEKNEKISAATLHSALWFFVWPMYRLIIGQVSRFYDWSTRGLIELFTTNTSYPEGFAKLINNTHKFFGGFNSILFAVFVAFIILCGILPLAQGKGSKLPFKKTAERFFGQ